MHHRVGIFPPRGAHAAVQLAFRELADHLGMACRGVRLARTRAVDRAAFVLGTFEDLGETVLGQPLANDRWTDRVLVRSDGPRLILAGSNPRSVLFAVYTYLDTLGFAWFMPGDAGRVVPRLKAVPLAGYAIDHTASLIYRGMGLAGAYDGERGERFVQWMARNRLNYLFMEGDSRRASYEADLRTKLTPAQARRHDRQVLKAAKQRGLLHEKMGHGWTARVLGRQGAPGPGRHGRPRRGEVTPQQLAMAAERNGQRSVASGNTQLCLSNPQANEQMVRHVTAYAAGHPELDVLGVWLADGFNNWCECERCAQVHPADQWVRLINRIAPAVHTVRPDLRIEVLSYATLMEPPPTERIDNRHGNVIFMYAPFIRCYEHTLDDPACVTDVPLKTFPPANRLHYPMNREYFTFLRAWLERFEGTNHIEGTNYIFDYYCWLPIKRDFFEGHVPRTMCDDLKRYPGHGIHGMVDCSRAQSFWPTPLARWMQARASWDHTVDYDAEHRRLLELAFGKAHADVVDRYLALAYACLRPDPHGRAEERGFDPAKVRRFKRSLPAVRKQLAEAIARARGRCGTMLRRVEVHAAFTAMQLDTLLAEGAGEYDKAMALATQMHQLAQRHRRLLDGVADPPEFAWLERDTLDRLRRKQAGTWVRAG